MKTLNNNLNTEQLQNIHSLINILQMSLVHRRQIGSNKNTGELCFIERGEDNEVMYSPIDSEKEEWNFDEDGKNILMFDYQGIDPYINPTLTLHQAYNNPTSTIQEPYIKPTLTLQKNSFLIDDNKRIRFNSRRVADIISAEIKDLELKEKAISFENLILKKLSLSPSPASIRTTHNLYIEYIDIIDNKDYKDAKLEVLTNRLKETIPELEAKRNEVIRKKTTSSILRKIKIRVVTGILISLTFFGVYFYANNDFELEYHIPIESEVTSNIISSNKQINKPITIIKEQKIIRKSYTTSEIKKIILNTKLKIGEWRQNKIIESFQNKKFSNWEAINQVKKIATKKY